MLRSSAAMIIQEIDPYLRPACIRLEQAGSVRREKREVGDIELLAIERPGRPRPEFGKPVNAFLTHLDRAIFQLQEEGYSAGLERDGPRWKTIKLKPEMFSILKEAPVEIKVDLFIVVPPAQWGVQMVIRTGPGGKGGFSQWMVTQRSKGGALPNGYLVTEGGVWKADQQGSGREDPAGEPVPMPEETDFFEFCGLPYIPPNERIPNWRRHR